MMKESEIKADMFTKEEEMHILLQWQSMQQWQITEELQALKL